MDFCLLLEIWGKNIVKNISKSVSGKYRQKRFDYDTQSPVDALKTTWKSVIQKGDMTGNKFNDKIFFFITNEEGNVELDRDIHR